MVSPVRLPQIEDIILEEVFSIKGSDKRTIDRGEFPKINLLKRNNVYCFQEYLRKQVFI